jgi:uncharacterized protein
MTRVFLDANVLFSAAWREGNGLLRLWKYPDYKLVTSSYALREAEHNISLKKPEALKRLHNLMEIVEVTEKETPPPENHGLPDKDIPILAAALASKCSVLLTGDVADFGHLFGQPIGSLLVMTPRDLFRLKA